MTRPRHTWSDPYRTEYATERACWTCGLVRVTRHEPGVRPWVEFRRGGRGGVRADDGSGRTPPCEGEAPQATGEAV